MFNKRKISKLEKEAADLKVLVRKLDEALPKYAYKLFKHQEEWQREQGRKQEEWRKSISNHNALIEKFAQGIHDNLKLINERLK